VQEILIGPEWRRRWSDEELLSGVVAGDGAAMVAYRDRTMD